MSIPRKYTMGPVGCICLVVIMIISFYCMYCYLWKNEDYTGKYLKTNMIDLLFGRGKVPE